MTRQSPSASLASSSYSTSPLRSSPLTNPPVYSPSRTPSPSPHRRTSHGYDRAKPRAIPTHRAERRRSALGYQVTPSPSSSRSILPSPSPSPSPSNLTHSPAASTSASSPPLLSRSHPLLGSYSLSLLHSRMSHAHTPHSIPSTSASRFSLHIGALGKGKSCPPELRCPKHQSIPFHATYYDIEESGGRGTTQTPWVGTVDLEQHYFSTYSSPSTLSSSAPGPSSSPPRQDAAFPPNYPGYKVAPYGQLQILIKTPTAAVRVFLVPYDLRRMPIGGRLLARERTYVESTSMSTSPDENGSRRILKYSIQLQFTCVADHHDSPSPRDSSTTRFERISIPSPSEASTSVRKAYYVSRSIKVIFTSSPPASYETSTTERTDEMILPADYSPSPSPSPSFSSSVSQDERNTGEGENERGRVYLSKSRFGSLGSGRTEEWAVVRQKWLAKKRMAEQMSDPESPEDEGREHCSGPDTSPRNLEHPDSPPFKKTAVLPVVSHPERTTSPGPVGPVRSLSPSAERGFSPVPALPPSSLSLHPDAPGRISTQLRSPISTLPALPLVSAISTSRPPSRSTTPTPACPSLSFVNATASAAAAGASAVVTPLSGKSPNVSGSGKKGPGKGIHPKAAVAGGRRRGSGSREERELSEKLRNGLDVRDE